MDTIRITPLDALIVVDVQNDFCEGGALAVRDASAIVPIINALYPRFAHVFLTRDWHPADHCSFCEEPQFVDKSWPVHCVEDTPGAAFHPQLAIPPTATVVNKATDVANDVYSGFGGHTTNGRGLVEELRLRAIQRIFICGIATDYCVRATAIDGIHHGFETFVIEDACRAVDNPAGTGQQAIEEMRAAGVVTCRSTQIQ